MNFIEELYYGNIDPQAREVRRGSPLDKAMALLAKDEGLLAERLTGEEKRLLLEYVSACSESLSISEKESFLSGFRLGAQCTFDTFLSEEGQTCSLLKKETEES